MKDAVLLLLCAVALAHGFVPNTYQNARRCNCDPSEAEKICEENFGNDYVVIAHEYCNKFYKCSNGKPVAYRCPNDLLYNPYAEECDWPENVECGDRPISEGNENDDADCDDGGDSDDDSVDDGDNDSDENTCNCDPSEAPTICAAEGSNGILIAHENCNQFYMCAEGKPVAFFCGPSLLYNPYNEECDWPQNVECGDRVIPEPDDNDTGNDSSDEDNDGNGDGDNDFTCNCNPEEAPTICAAADSDGILIAHENCEKFYICVAGKPVAVSCPGTLLYNPYTELCDWPRNVDCGDRIVPESEDCAMCNDSDETGDGGDDCDEGDDIEVLPPPDNDDDEGDDIDDLPPPDDDTGDEGDDIDVLPPPGDDDDAGDEGDDVDVLPPPGDDNDAGDEDDDVTLPPPEDDASDEGDDIDVLPPPGDDSSNENDDIDALPPPDDNAGNESSSSENESGGNDNVGAGNCDPSEAPTICAEEDSDGVLVAHENCNQFYICSGGKPVALKCPANLFFNPNTDRCDWPKNVDCGDRLIPDVEDDTENDSGGIEVSTPSGDDAEDESGSIEDLPPGGDDDGNDSDSIEELPPGGDDDGNDSDAIEISTPPGDDGSNENDDIDALPPPDDDAGNESSSSENESGGNDNVGAGNCDPSEAPNICAEDNSDGVLVAHENCNQFYICSGGKPVALKCPANLLFNPNTDQCDWPENVDCGDRVIPDVDDDNNDTDNDSSDNESGGNDNGGSDNESGESDNIGAGNCDPSEAPNICAEDDSDGVLVAHENCNQFYMCSGGKPVALKCPGNLLFNPNTDQCDWPENVDCGDRVIPDVDDDNNDTDNDSSDNESGGNDNGGSDNESGESDNIGAGNCDPSEAPTICAEDDSDGVLVAHENCNQFYKCSGGKPVALKCPGNLLFNPNTDRCDWPENVDCGDRVIPDVDDDNNDTDNDSSDNESGGNDNGGSDNESGESDNIGAGNCDPSEAPTICAEDDSDGVLVAHENCNQFYKCSGGKPVALKCPGNLLFNPNTDRCDWPENVDCGDRIIPDVEDDTENDSGGIEVSTPSGDDSEDESGSIEDLPPGGDDAEDDSGSIEDLPPGGEDDGNDNDGSDNESGGNDNESGGNDNESGDSDNVGAGNCDPSQAPNICAEDNSDGVLVAHENCNQFYICSGGKPVALKCPANLLFNPNTDRCDWPKNVDCGDRVIPDVEDDTENDSGGIEVSTPPGDDSDEESGSIEDLPPGGDDDGNDSDSIEGSTPPSDDAEDDSGSIEDLPPGGDDDGNDSGGVDVTTPPGDDAEDDSDSIEELPPGGDDDGNDSDGIEVSTPPSDDAEDDSGSIEDLPPGGDDDGNDSDGIEVSTPPGDDAEDDTGSIEDLPPGGDDDGNDSGGIDVSTPPGDDAEDDSDSIEDLPPGGDDNDNDKDSIEDLPPGGDDDCNDSDDDDCECHCDPDEASSICAVDGSDGELIAHQYCNHFFQCYNGRPVAFKCPSGLLYNPYTQLCDWPINVECGDRVIPDPEDDNDNDDENSNEVEEDDSDNDYDSCNCNPEEAPAICAADGSDGVMIAHENCNQFYQCAYGKPITITCPTNLLYNPFREICDWPENVECGDRVIPDPEEDDDNDTDDSDGNDSDENENGIVNDDPSQAPSICADSNSNGVFVAHENCDKFYLCSGGLPVPLSCAEGLLYNPITQQCDWPRNVDCGDRIVPESEDDCPCNPRNAPVLCSRSNSDGMLIAHENCNQFYICTAGVPIARYCAANLHYNPEKEVCDWPQNVDCNSRMLTYASLNKHLDSRQTLRK